MNRSISPSKPKAACVHAALFLILVSLQGLSADASAELQTPEEFLGHPVGADRKLADWDTIVRYIYHLTAESDRADVEELGESTLGKPFLMVMLGDEESLENRDRYQSIVRDLYSARSTDEQTARRLAREGKVLVALSLGLHSVEVGASQASLEMMYRLATSEDERTREIRQNCIVLMVPSMNPDGLDIIVDWYRSTVGSEAEGSRPPWLYHHYAGHDNNRDGFFNNLTETSMWSRMLYREWMPQIILDEHQMGTRGPRLFIPPFDDPVSPTVHRLVYSQLSAAGQQVVTDLTAKGWTGVATSTIFTAEWPGSVRSTGFWHNMLGILSEVASAQLATPLHFPPGSLEGSGRGLPAYERRANFLEPWPGGWWRLGDIVELELDLTWSLLGWAAGQKEQLLYNFYAMAEEAVARGRTEAPYGFVVGLNQHDAGSAHRLVSLLMDGGLEVGFADSGLSIEGRNHPEGAYVIRADQPFRPFLLEMLDSPRYPKVRGSGEGEVIQPYDVTAWDLTELLGVEVQPLKQPWPGEWPRQVHRPQRALSEYNGGAALLSARDNASYAAVAAILADGGNVERLIEHDDAGRRGDFLVEGGSELVTLLVAKGANPRELAAPTTSAPRVAQTLPKTALYAPWGGSMDEGWTRYVLDRFAFPHDRIRNGDFAALASRRDGAQELLDDFDVVIFPSISSGVLTRGRQPQDPENSFAPRWPEEYLGGLDIAEVAPLLESYVRLGGTIVAMGQSCSWIVEQLGLPARIELDDLPREEFYAPGTLLRADVDTDHPLAWGMAEDAAVYFARGSAFRPIPWTGETAVVASFAREDVAVAGFLTGAHRIEGLPGLLDIPLGQGNVVLFGFKPQHRAQTEGCFKLLLNSLLRSAAGADRGVE